MLFGNGLILLDIGKGGQMLNEKHLLICSKHDCGYQGIWKMVGGSNFTYEFRYLVSQCLETAKKPCLIVGIYPFRQVCFFKFVYNDPMKCLFIDMVEGWVIFLFLTNDL